MCRTPVARVTTAATAGATYPQGSQASECLIVPYIRKFGSLSHPQGLEEDLWSTDRALVASVRLDDLIIFNFMSHISYMPNLGSLSHPHGLEEAPVVHRPGPGHLPDLIIFNSKSYSPYILNMGSLSHSHGLKEAPEVHRPGPGHLVDVGQPHHWSFPVQ